MSVVEVAVPQMGEGLQEVRVVSLSKKPGESVKRDETLYVMETDKAMMEVESPYDGVLQEWLAAEDDVLAIGAPICRIDAAEHVADPDVPQPQGASFAPSHSQASSSPVLGAGGPSVPGRPVVIPPRTRAIAREHGLTEEDLAQIPAPSGKLMPDDVLAFLADREGSTKAGKDPLAPPLLGAGGALAFTEKRLSPQQRGLAFHMRRSALSVIPATMRRFCNWEPLRRFVSEARAADTTRRPTEFQTLAYAIARAAQVHPKFRSTLAGDDTVHEYPHVNLGIAVARADGDLVTAVVPAADTLSYTEFIDAAQARIQSAREGQNQAASDTQLVLTYLGALDIVDGIPVLVSPAIGTLFVGAPHTHDGRTVANLALTFDHRLINGMEAAEFLRTVVEMSAQAPA